VIHYVEDARQNWISSPVHGLIDLPMRKLERSASLRAARRRNCELRRPKDR
jgi:hypothetical protein